MSVGTLNGLRTVSSVVKQKNGAIQASVLGINRQGKREIRV